ncbi:MAG: prepilin-type N-terminal cleavage/methylation domain-containing protein [Armatimonadetes bacterium]|nr:prepilin-type N-terminal cleavage/methylation domain-containing protein [Armatimonadota bacterium]
MSVSLWARRRRRTGQNRVRHAAFNLIELLVVIVILGAIAIYVWPRYFGGGSNGAQRYTGPVSRARDTVCQSNLGQLRASLQALSASDPEGKPPATLTELAMPREMTSCATGGEPYRYDPATGRVQCPHPGHEGY